MHRVSVALVGRIAVVVVVLAVFPAEAWWCTGHMTVAQIAKSTMSATAVARVNTIIGDLSVAGPFPRSPDMVQVACWADDLKEYSLTPMNNWHFVDGLYNPSNYPIDPKLEVMPEETVDHVMAQLDKGVAANTMRGTNNTNKQWVLQLAVAFLIHFYGDVHQPLHATQLFSKEYPTGDRGGNFERVIANGTNTNLHAFWDSVCWTQNVDMVRPLTSSSSASLQTFASRLLQTYTFPTSVATESNSTIMAKESYNAAVQYVYPGVTSGMVISQAYTDRCIPVAEARITLAGLRLGHILEGMFGDAAEFSYVSPTTEDKDGDKDGSITDASKVLVKRIHRRLAEIIVARQTGGINPIPFPSSSPKPPTVGSRLKSIIASLRG